MRDIVSRSLADIEADIAAANMRLAQLEIELAEAKDSRRCSVIKAFDDGATRQQIVASSGLTYPAVSKILHTAGRSERQRQALGLTLKQESEFRRLTRGGVPSKIARRIATAGGAVAAP